MISYIRETRGQEPLTGVEIGVAQAHHARSILETLNMTMLFLVDPYIPYIEGNRHIDYGELEEEAHQYLEAFTARTTWLRGSSTDPAILAQIPIVDFVYIDGKHTYEQVKADILAYLPKIRKGGLLGGHDYYHEYPSVLRAVNELIPSERLQHATYDWFTKC
jgi:hypothetical protein